MARNEEARNVCSERSQNMDAIGKSGAPDQAAKDTPMPQSYGICMPLQQQFVDALISLLMFHCSVSEPLKELIGPEEFLFVSACSVEGE